MTAPKVLTSPPPRPLPGDSSPAGSSSTGGVSPRLGDAIGQDLATRPIPRRPPISSFETRRRIEFSDTDMGGIVHFSRFFVFMETAEHELLRSIGAEIHSLYEGRALGWPRLTAHCDYASPARLGQELSIRVEVERKGTKSMTYRFLFHDGDRLVARGRLTSACCLLDDPDGLRAVPIPPFIAEQLEEVGDGD